MVSILVAFSPARPLAGEGYTNQFEIPKATTAIFCGIAIFRNKFQI